MNQNQKYPIQQIVKKVMQKIVDTFQFDQSTCVKEDGFQIYTAKHLHQKEYYTLKKLTLKGNSDQSKYKSLLNEVSLLKELQFENIIKFHRMLKTPNSIYLVYDYIPPNNLYAVIQTQVKKLAEFEKEAYLKQVCTALMHMKSKNIVHLNLHPKNIYITQDGIVKIGGFIYGQILGTQKQIQLMNIPPQSQFVAPEVLSKKVGSFFSDMYSLARIFYALQMCTEEKSLLSVGNMTSSTQNQLSSLVKRMGSKNPTHRATLEQVHAYLFRRASKLRRSNSRSSNSNLAATVGSTKGSSRAGNIIKAQKSDKGGSSRNLDISNKSKSRSRSIRRSNSNAGSDIQEASSPVSRSKGGTSPEQQAKQANSFKKFVCQVLRIRNFAIFLLKLSLNTACLSLGSQKSTILSYLLLKKSTIVICNLADYASNGEAEVDIKASQIQKIKFASKPDFFKVSSIINKQMNVQKKMLERTRKDIQQEYPELTKQEKFGVQLKRDALDEKYLKQSVVEYMKILISDENMLKSLDKSNLEGIFMLSQVIASESYERMFDNFIKDQEIDLQAQPLFLHIKAMDSAALVASILKKTKKLI